MSLGKIALVVGVIAVGGYLFYRYSQNSQSTVPTASATALSGVTDPGQGSIINQAAAAAGQYVGSQLSSTASSLFDTGGGQFGDSSLD